jgi:ribosomal protein L7/L12
MSQFKTLEFPNTSSGQARKNRTLEIETSQGWRVVSETIVPGKFKGSNACCLFLIFAPCAFLAGHEDGVISVTLERDNAPKRVQQNESPPAAPSTSVNFDRAKWNALLQYDPEVAAAAKSLSGLDPKWTDELASSYLALGDKQYLPTIVSQILERSQSEQREASFVVDIKSGSPDAEDDYSVILVAVGNLKINAIKAVREATGMSLKDAKDAVENAPRVLKTNMKLTDAEELKYQLESIGATVELQQSGLSSGEGPAANSPRTSNADSWRPSAMTGASTFTESRSHRWVAVGIAAVVVAFALWGILALVNKNAPNGNDQSAQSAADTTSGAESPSSTIPSRPAIPADEAKFISAVASAQTAYDAAPNDMAKGGTRADRRNAICQALPNASVSNWLGTIKSLSSNGDGKGVLEVTLAQDISVTTNNNAFSDTGDDTLLSQDSPVFQTASKMKEGDKIFFSGDFLPSETDCFRELSVTLEGSMKEPAFLIRFTSVADPSAPSPQPNTESDSAQSAPVQPAIVAAPAPQEVSPPAQADRSGQLDNGGKASDSEQTNTVNQPSSDSTAPQSSPSQSQSHGKWYYCDPAKAYYPYVSRCPIPWRAVIPNSTNSQANMQQPEANAPPAKLDPNSPPSGDNR